MQQDPLSLLVLRSANLIATKRRRASKLLEIRPYQTQKKTVTGVSITIVCRFQDWIMEEGDGKSLYCYKMW